MKKFLVFLMLISLLSMTACDKENSEENSGEKADVTNVGGVTPPEEESTPDPHEGWTWLISDVYIPDLPFSDWGGQNQDNINCYTVYIKSYNSSAFHEYAKSLADFGYTLEQTESYSYRGTDPENRSISLTDHENGQMQISIYY